MGKKIMLATALLGLAVAAYAHSPVGNTAPHGHAAVQTGVKAGNAWARFTVPGMQAGGVFLQLDNGARADALLGGSTPVAAEVEIHEHALHNGTMRMRTLPNGLPLPANTRVELKPGGYHVMLIGLKQPLADGSTFPLTLKFRHAPAQTVQVEVRSPRDEAEGVHQHHHGH